MNLIISVKQLGRKHPLLEQKQIVLNTDKAVISFRELLELVVEEQVRKFEESSFETDDIDATHLPFDNYLPMLVDTGKIGFGAIYNHSKPNLAKAQQTAIQAFEDGIFVVFYGDDELRHLEQEINLDENKTTIFIRLTFLAGSYW